MCIVQPQPCGDNYYSDSVIGNVNDNEETVAGHALLLHIDPREYIVKKTSAL